jgi:hypothetical protein
MRAKAALAADEAYRRLVTGEGRVPQAMTQEAEKIRRREMAAILQQVRTMLVH